MRRLLIPATLAVCLQAAAISALSAQVVDSTRVKADSAIVAASLPTVAVSNRRARLSPPISPKRAFLYSLALPGYGQSRLDRGTSGALFSSIELAALVMVRRSKADVHEAERYVRDTLPLQFTVAGGIFSPTGSFPSRYVPDLVRTRRLHVEDWLAVLAFNHLFAAADAFVAAQLWDVPVTLSARTVHVPTPRGERSGERRGALLVATWHF